MITNKLYYDSAIVQKNLFQIVKYIHFLLTLFAKPTKVILKHLFVFLQIERKFDHFQFFTAPN
jgi:hypothetical protein